MPTLACHVCGRVVYTTSSLDTLFAEERRCPRCGSILDVERRHRNQRKADRRQSPPDEPGPPGGIERRIGDRRNNPRRHDDRPTFGDR